MMVRSEEGKEKQIKYRMIGGLILVLNLKKYNFGSSFIAIYQCLSTMEGNTECQNTMNGNYRKTQISSS
jgi:hypothetical protein